MKIFFYGVMLFSLTGASLNATLSLDNGYQQGSDEHYEADGGIGALITADEYGIKIESVFENSPASAAGLFSGDYIWAIDGVEITDWDLADAVEAIRGEIGTSVSLTIRRYGVELTVSIVRESLRYDG